MLSTPPARVVNEVALHSVQKKITEKIELITNFASIKNQIRYLVNQLNFYDRPTAPGLISYEDFLHYFVRRLNFMGLNKELEFVFFHYDEQMTGFLDYKYFAQQLYSNITPCYPILTKDSMESLEKMRVHILGRTCDTHNILRFLRQLNELPGQKDGFITAITFAQHLSVMLDKDYSTFYWRREVTNLLECFDILHDKTNVHIPTFARYLLSPFAIYRKQLVRAIYDMLSANHPGFPTVEDVRTCYVASPQNPIEFRGKLFAPTSLNELLQFFINDNHNNHNTITDKSVSSSDHNNYHIYDHEIITWSSFLTYYESLSMIIDKEEHFEYIVRRSWSIPYAPSGEEFYLTTLNFVGSGPASVRGPPSPNATNHGFAPITIVTSGITPRSGKGSADDYDDRSLASHSFAGDSKTSSPPSTASPTSRRSRSGARSPSKTIHRRVIVVHSDQSSEVVKIVDELGKTRLDKESVRKELVAMGIDDIQDIKL